MCGIAAAIGWPQAEAVVKELVRGISHRGLVTDPIISIGDETAFGTRRLPIVDPNYAIQPQLSPDNTVLLIFNGEIYNHISLRVELEALGVKFRTNSDTEVLACALSVWGISALDRLNGIYAFVAFVLPTGDFIAARDPMGVKPLYVVQSNDGFLFCSEIRPLLSATIALNVHFIPPGCFLTKGQLRRFKSVVEAPATRVASNPLSLDATLRKAVELRLPPELPCATMFSGGIDSTLVTHYARQFRPETPGYFLGDSTAPDYSYAAKYADRTKLDFRCVALPNDKIVDHLSDIDRIVECLESFEPDVVRGSLCTSVLAEQMRRDGYKVVLSGEGADELFSGYLPLEIAFAESDEMGAFVRDQHLEAMHCTNLQRLDRSAMQFQIEVREPFLDLNVISHAMSLSGEDLVLKVGTDYWGKQPLRSLYDIYPDALPAEIRNRRKLPLNEGCGFDKSMTESPWSAFAASTITDAEFIDGKSFYSDYNLITKEELLYIRALSATLDIARVPHLKQRKRLKFPSSLMSDRLEPFLVPSP